MGEIAATHDMVASAVLYTRLANMGLGVLIECDQELSNTNMFRVACYQVVTGMFSLPCATVDA